MKEAPNTMTEMDEPEARAETKAEERPTRRLFGRRDKNPRELRTETEWVDTLVAHEDAEAPIPSPFAAPSEPEPQPEPYPFAGLPGPEPMADEETYSGRYAHEWRRRQNDSLESIHQFIDHVIGTEHDPRHRISRRAVEYGLRHRVQRGGTEVSAVRVEGLPDDLLIAFTFPEDEFRGARVVYETEGGYVVEVRRAIGGQDENVETQYYTVSRVGEVAHVLDKLRAREAARRAEAHETVHVAPPPSRVEPIEPLPAAPRHEPEPEPEPEPFTAPAPPEPEEAPGVDTATGIETPGDEAEGRRGFGLLRRKGKEAPEEPAAPPAAAAAEELRRHEDAADDEKKSRFGSIAGRFRRKSREGEEEPPEM